MITKELAGRTLSELGAAHDRIATSMYTVDTHAAWPLLRGGLVAGATQRRGQELQAEVDRLWACFATLGEQLERARALNAPRRPADPALADLTELLTTPVVTLDASGLPVDPTGAVASRITLDELARQSEERCAAVLSQLSDVDSCAAAVAGEYVRATVDLDALVALATGMGEASAAQRARAAAAEVERLDLHDPLTAAPGGQVGAGTRARLDVLREAVSAARHGLDQLVAVRDDYPRRRAELVGLLDQLAAQESAVAQAQARAEEKIAAAGLAPVPAATSVLRSRLAALDGLHGSAQWRRLATAMSTVEDEARRALAAAGLQRAAAVGLLDRRDELRGRLTAYRAKAVALGFAEDPDLTSQHAAAQALLYTAPCDLRAATRAVHTYAAALASRAPASEKEDQA